MVLLRLICISYNPFFRNMAKKASKEVRSFLSEIGRIGGTTGKGTQKRSRSPEIEDQHTVSGYEE